MRDAPEGLLDSKGAREMLKLSERGLYRLVASGKLPHYRVGGQLRFDRAELLEATRVDAERESV